MPDLKNLRVCFLAGTLGRGGAERQLIYMLEALATARISTRVLCLTQGEPFEQDIKAMGVPVEWVGASDSRPIRLWRIIQALRREPAHIVQSVHFYTNLYATVAARVLGLRELGAIRSDLFNELNDKGSWGWAQLKAPRHLIANSALARQRAIDRGIKSAQIDLVRNSVKTQETNDKVNENGHQPIRILFVGRLVQEKRADRFLRVLAKVLERLPEQTIRARIAGDGPVKDSLVALAQQLRLGKEHLEFLGESGDMSTVYRDADLLLLTSDLEGTPNVLLEAMTWSLPIVATRVGGVPEIISEDRGYLAAPEDEDKLAEAVVQLVCDAKLRQRMGRSGREYVTHYHSLDALTQQMTDVYEKIICR
jgi:glycosyltransferase involved in cell wall biosynthesis